MAPKRTASHLPNARPAKKRIGKVPAILSEALAVLPQAEYNTLLNTHVLPGIDDCSFRSVFELAIQKFKAKDEIDQLINFKQHKQEFHRLAKDLKFSLKHHWGHGWEEQTELMYSIVGLMQQWMAKLFQVACERGLELDMVQKCLILMEKHLSAIKHAHMRVSYDEQDWEFRVSSSQGEIRYDGQPDCVLCLFWRDVLLTAIVQNDKAVLSKYKVYCDVTDNGMTDLLSHISGVAAQKHREDTKCKLCDEWHSNDMKAAVPRLRKFLQTIV